MLFACSGGSTAETLDPTSIEISGAQVTGETRVLVYEQTTPRADGTFPCGDGSWSIILNSDVPASSAPLLRVAVRAELWSDGRMLVSRAMSEAWIQQHDAQLGSAAFGFFCTNELMLGRSNGLVYSVLVFDQGGTQQRLRTAEVRINYIR